MMRRARNCCRAAAALLVLLMLVILPCSAQAQSHSEAYGDGAIHVHVHSGDNTIHPAGVRLSLYEVAEGSCFAHEAHLLPDFSETQTHCSVDDMVTRSAASSRLLEDWVEHRHPVTPVMTVESDADGEIEFDHLEDGIYLICQENGAHDFDGQEYTVSMEPYLVEIPSMDEAGNLYSEIDCQPKLLLSSIITDTVSVEVEKHWEDQNDRQALRPDSIEVSLCRDGSEAERVTLSAANNWRYVWEGLDADSEWTVEETAVPDGYRSTVSAEGNSFVITNQLQPDEEKPPGHPPDEPGGNTTVSKGQTGGGSAIDPKGRTDESRSVFSRVRTGDSRSVCIYFAVAAACAVSIALLQRRRTGK